MVKPDKDNVVPIRELVNHEDNVYELTSAAIKRSEQITVTRNEELKKKKIKIVSEALREVLEKDVQYDYKEN